MDSAILKQKLEREKSRLEEELAEIAKRNPRNPADWEAVPGDQSETTFRDEVADRLEDLDERHATEVPLETQLHEVDSALARLASGAYGHCKICGKTIEAERLEINPAAETCKDHLNET